MFVSCVGCVLHRYWSLRRADPSSRAVIPCGESVSLSVNKWKYIILRQLVGIRSQVQVQVPHHKTEGPEGAIGIALLFLYLGARRGGWSAPPTGRFTPGKTRYPLYRRLGGPQGRSGQVRKTSPQPGFDLRAVQPVASCDTDWAFPAPKKRSDQSIILILRRILPYVLSIFSY
jgi:hypothetical protein